MIIYDTGPFGLHSLWRIHGSAVYKNLIPAAFSTLVVAGYYHYVFPGAKDHIIGHPNVIGAFISFFSFMLTFRLNFSYGRYWEGATAVQHMLSKWLDCSMATAAFHYQATMYDDIKPPAYGDHPQMQDDNQRKRYMEKSLEETTQQLQELERETLQTANQNQWWFPWLGIRRRRRHRHTQQGQVPEQRKTTSEKKTNEIGKSINAKKPDQAAPKDESSQIPIPFRFQEQFRIQAVATADVEERHKQARRALLVKQSRASLHLVANREAKLPAPSLFLQEMAHLLSLLSAVALSTLRNDIEEAPEPVVEYFPGQMWPPVDPDNLASDIKMQYGQDTVFWTCIYFIFGLSRSTRHRTLYNAARPMRVLGGVSDAEIAMLQLARGPYAKVSLCTMWLQEFLTREHLSGSTGQVAPPIVSSLYQFISAGMIGYNQARKVAYIPFPFAHSQLTTLFSLAIIFIFPLLYAGYVNSLAFACALNFLTVLCFLGMHEVSRELERPFQNAPNDIPLTTYQAQFNEALVTVYASYHPDAWWEPPQKKSKKSKSLFV